MSGKKKWAVQNTVYLDAKTYEEAIEEFWRLMDKGGISAVTALGPRPNCFVSDVEHVISKGNLE